MPGGMERVERAGNKISLSSPRKTTEILLKCTSTIPKHQEPLNLNYVIYGHPLIGLPILLFKINHTQLIDRILFCYISQCSVRVEE